VGPEFGLPALDCVESELNKMHTDVGAQMKLGYVIFMQGNCDYYYFLLITFAVICFL
jgi:hypothetical protein